MANSLHRVTKTCFWPCEDTKENGWVDKKTLNNICFRALLLQGKKINALDNSDDVSACI